MSLNQFELKIVLQYFDSLNDYINFSKTCKLNKEILSVCEYNPISIKSFDEFIILSQLFENLKYYHVYNEDDYYVKSTLKANQIEKIIWWIPKSINFIKNNPISRNIYKSMILNADDFNNNFSLDIFPHLHSIRINKNLDSKRFVEYLNEYNENNKILKPNVIDFSYLFNLTEFSEGLIKSLINNYNYNEIILPKSIVKIRALAFNSLLFNKINLIDLNNLESLGDYSFKDCINLEKIVFNDNAKIKIIPDSCFMTCTKLTEIHLPSCITEIQRKAFIECSNLININLTDLNLKIIEKYAFYNTNIPKIKLKHLEILEDNVFNKCDNLRKIDLYECNKLTEFYGFRSSNNLNKIKLPPSLKIIKNCRFTSNNLKINISDLNNLELIESSTINDNK